jgi:hypothetical protein
MITIGKCTLLLEPAIEAGPARQSILIDGDVHSVWVLLTNEILNLLTVFRKTKVSFPLSLVSIR